MEGLIFAIDLGGTSTKLAILTNEGGFVHKWQIPTDTSEKGQNILPHIKEAFLSHFNRIRSELRTIYRCRDWCSWSCNE